MFYDRLYIDGTPLHNLATITETWGGLTQGARRGTNLVVPGFPGEIFIPKGRDVPTITFGLVLLAVDPNTGAEAVSDDDRNALLDTNYRTLTRLVAGRTDRPLSLVRELGTEQHEAIGELSRPLEPAVLGSGQGLRLTLELRILSGLWYATATEAADDISTTPVTVTSAGDATTTRIQATFGAAGILTNATMGTSITASQASTVDVEMLTATAGHASGRFGLVPGDNVITASGTTVDLTWHEAYL